MLLDHDLGVNSIMSRDLPPDSPFSFFQETADRGNPRVATSCGIRGPFPAATAARGGRSGTGR